MHPRFENIIRDLPVSLAKLLACHPISGGGFLPAGAPSRAVYLFTENGIHLYVGRTNRLRQRYREHVSGKNNDAPFAFKLARYETRIFKSRGGPTRKALEQDPAFGLAFRNAKTQVRNMEFRYVEETDDYRQCLLEIYATVELSAKFNDFANH